MSGSRTKNVSVNTVWALICQVFNLLLTFVIRTFFIRILGTEYLGVNGLFSNVLTILSFAELGIGNAIIFSMYKPLAAHDEKKISALMKLYKKAYTGIGLIVAGAGLCVLPFLKYIVKSAPDIPESLALLYLLFLANTVSSYFFVYKKNILIADQKSYIPLIVTQIITVLRAVFQIGFLYATHQYIVYLVIQIASTFAENVICSLIVDRMYPFLKKESETLEKEEVKGIFKNVKALAIYKFGSVILNGTDNILISKFIGVWQVGLVSNYTLLVSSCNSILSRVSEAFTASVGNLNVYSDREKQYAVFQKIFFLTAWIYGFACVGLALVIGDFITAWIGGEYLLSKVVLAAILAEFYVKGVHYAAYTYRCTLGYFVQGRWSALVAAAINLVLSILFCQWIGLAGIFIATPIARMLTTGLVDPILVYKKTFQMSPIRYYLMYAGYTLAFGVAGIVSYAAIRWLPFGGWVGVFVEIIVVSVVFNLAVVLMFGRTRVFREIVRMGLSVVKPKR